MVKEIKYYKAKSQLWEHNLINLIKYKVRIKVVTRLEVFYAK